MASVPDNKATRAGEGSNSAEQRNALLKPPTHMASTTQDMDLSTSLPLIDDETMTMDLQSTGTDAHGPERAAPARVDTSSSAELTSAGVAGARVGEDVGFCSFVPWEELCVGESIGRGAHGEVRKGRYGTYYSTHTHTHCKGERECGEWFAG